MLKPLAILALLVIAGFVVYSYYPYTFSALVSYPKIEGADQATKFVLEDLKSEPAEKRVVSATESGGKWYVDVLLSTGPHSACPKLERRNYELLPIGFRSEKILADCSWRAPIAYREEALIDSTKVMTVPQGAFGCAFYLSDYDPAGAADYCYKLDEGAFLAFAGGLGTDSWVVAWISDGGTQFVAFDRNGAVIKKTA